jgi:lipopolysaccharide biosynthesis glycosyltransferase
MKNLIYQYWHGKQRTAVKYGVENMKAYAQRIGAEYIFSENPRWAEKLCNRPEYYNAFEPVFNEKFEKYDKILFADTDVFAVENLTENAFEQDIAEIGICDEPHKELSHLTTKSPINKAEDEKWNRAVVKHFGKEMPRNSAGNLKIFNSGVVLYTQKGREKARKNWVPFDKYINTILAEGCNKFYSIDQNYLNAMLIIADHEYTVMDSGWNSYVHFDGDSKTKLRAVIDTRTDSTKFVHVQLRGADDRDGKWHNIIVNRPTSEWKSIL